MTSVVVGRKRVVVVGVLRGTHLVDGRGVNPGKILLPMTVHVTVKERWELCHAVQNKGNFSKEGKRPFPPHYACQPSN